MSKPARPKPRQPRNPAPRPIHKFTDWAMI